MKFKSTADKKKFLRSIEDTEGVSLESASSDDEDIVEQSLMQLDPVSGETSEEEEEGDLHILMLNPDSLLDDPDIAMDSILLDPGASTEALDSGVSDMLLEGGKSSSPMSMKAGCSSSGFSPLDTALLNTPMNTPVAPIPSVKDEKNPFSPEQYPNIDEEMFPPLGSPSLASTVVHPEASAVIPISAQNYLLFGGVYYQPVPPPHNVVLSQSAIPKPALVPVESNTTPPVVPAENPLPATDTETNGSDLEVPFIETHSASVAPANAITESPPKPEIKGDQEFAVPKEPSPCGSTKAHRKPQPRSRSSSSPCSETPRIHHPQGVNPFDPSMDVKRVRGIGRGKKRESTNPLAMATSTLLSGAALPRNDIRITVPAGGGPRKVEVLPDYPANVAHLAPLENETKRLEDDQLSSTIKPDFMVKLSREDPQEDSEVDLDTGEIKNPHAQGEPRQFSFQSPSILEDHQQFAQEVLKLEPDSWDCAKIESNPSLFYHAYFLDQQKLNEVRQKGAVRIQQFNVKVTRQP